MTPASRFTILIYEGAVCPLPHSHLDPDDVILKVRVQRLRKLAAVLINRVAVKLSFKVYAAGSLDSKFLPIFFTLSWSA